MEIVGWLVITIFAIGISLQTAVGFLWLNGMTGKGDNSLWVPFIIAIFLWWASITNFPFTITMN